MSAIDVRRVAVTLVALGGLVGLTAGCGADHTRQTLTKAEVIKRGSAICKAAERRLEKLPAPTTEHPFARGTSQIEQRHARRFVAGYADALESSRVGLKRLAAPPQDRRLLNGYLTDIASVADTLRMASRADARLVEPQANRAFQLFARASTQTAAYGFPKGVCGSGSSV